MKIIWRQQAAEGSWERRRLGGSLLRLISNVYPEFDTESKSAGETAALPGG
jgi:hypothetical protein